jgi:hypothetical protein
MPLMRGTTRRSAPSSTLCDTRQRPVQCADFHPVEFVCFKKPLFSAFAQLL